MEKTSRNLVEIFGFSPDDFTASARKYWDLKACPFTGRPCTKYDHTKTICYGTCSVSSGESDVVICPNRLYEKNYSTIRNVAKDAFGDSVKMLFFEEYVKLNRNTGSYVVALGQNSGKEVKLSQMSMDWVLAHISEGELVEYVGIEVQSIDITGNYRDAWYAAKNMETKIPKSAHGLNWANVHKRLIPQLIRKGLIYSKSSFVKKGLYFIVPEIVFNRFENILGNDIPTTDTTKKDTITVYTYALSHKARAGTSRSLMPVRRLRFKMSDFSSRFITGPNLPKGTELDNKIREILAIR